MMNNNVITPMTNTNNAMNNGEVNQTAMYINQGTPVLNNINSGTVNTLNHAVNMNNINQGAVNTLSHTGNLNNIETTNYATINPNLVDSNSVDTNSTEVNQSRPNSTGSLVERHRFRSLDDFHGNPVVVQTLKNSIIQDMIHPTNIFIGRAGSGKTSAALVYGKSINCSNSLIPGKPCDACPSCLAAATKNGNPDILEINAASNNGVDCARKIAELVNRRPTFKKIVIILDEWHRMSPNALDALLTVFESASRSDATVSPSDYMFIMPTTELPTEHIPLLSRARRFFFKPMPKHLLVEKLKSICIQDGYTFEDEALELICNTSNGGTREAFTLLESIAVYNTFNISLEATRDYISLEDSTLAPELFKAIHSLDITKTTDLIVNYTNSRPLNEGDFNKLSNLIQEASNNVLPVMQEVYTKFLRTIRDERMAFIRDNSLKQEDSLIIACREMIFSLKDCIAPAICELIKDGNKDFGHLINSLNPTSVLENGQLLLELDTPKHSLNQILMGLNTPFIKQILSSFGVSNFSFRNAAPEMCNYMIQGNRRFGEIVLSLKPYVLIEQNTLVFEMDTPPNEELEFIYACFNSDFTKKLFNGFGVSQYRFR